MTDREMHGKHELDPKRLQDFICKLNQFENQRIYLKDLLQLFNTAFPHRPRGAELRRWVLTALQQAAKQNIIQLPPENGKRWDRKFHPPLPTSVDQIDRGVISPDQAWRQFPWHLALAWVPDLARLTPEQEAFLRQVHNGLVQGLFQQPAPLKYRSLQLTGNEKRLKRLMRTVLFSPGRLSLDLLGCVCDIPPLVYETVGSRATVIVFENVEPYKVALRVLMQMDNPPYGIVAFGGGACFEQSIRHFGSMGQSLECIKYVGDLDRPGLRIAQAGAKVAYETGLPPLMPAEGIHYAMLEAVKHFGYPLGLPCEVKTSAKDEDLVAWLPDNIRPEVLNILRQENRIPEEILSSNEMASLWSHI